MMKVVQLSDCHVPASADTPYRGADPRATLEALVPVIRDWGPDLVLATGDLSEDGSEASYRWLAGALERLGVPVLTTPGNHDDGALMHRHFSRVALLEPLVADGDWRLVVLNSAVTGEVPGRIDEGQLEALDRLLAETGRPVLVALHHQPAPVGSPWIDRYPLLNPEPLLERLTRASDARLVVWGHVHQDVRLAWDGLIGLGAPSTVSNSLPGEERFTVDPAGPAARWLELEASGEFRTGLLRAS